MEDGGYPAEQDQKHYIVLNARNARCKGLHGNDSKPQYAQCLPCVWILEIGTPSRAEAPKIEAPVTL